MLKNLYPNSIRIGLLDPSIAQTWAQRILSDGTTVGSIKKGDTINHTTSQPIATGLFCQRIFGPCIDYTCACGHEKIRLGFNPNIAPPVCPECHVEWTHASVRRQFLGSIDLISPVTHKWFSDSRGAYIPTLLGITPRTFRNLKECKLFFPFALKSSQELLHINHSLPSEKQKKNVNAFNSVKSRPLVVSKNIANTFRAMHTLKFLINPQKPLNPYFLQNLQLTNNHRNFWFLSNKPLNLNKISTKSLFSKFSDVCMLASIAYFPSTVIDPKNKPETNYKYSIVNKTFGEEISFHNSQNHNNKVFSNLQVNLQKLLAEKEQDLKEKNFDLLITTTQWLTVEQACLTKERIIELYSKKGKNKVKNLLSSEQPEKLFDNSKKKNKDSLQLKVTLEKKKDNFNIYAGNKVFSKAIVTPEISRKDSSAYKKESVIKHLYPKINYWTKKNQIKTKSLGQSRFWSKNLNQLEPTPFKNNNVFSDWKAKSFLSKTNRKHKPISTNNFIDTLGLKNHQDYFLKKKNLQYVLVFAQKLENNNSNFFSESFSLLALQNNEVSLSSRLQPEIVINTKEKKTVLANFFTEVKKIKDQNFVNDFKLGTNLFSLRDRNGTYIFRDFTKYKLKESPEILFGKNEKLIKLFDLHSPNKTKFGSKIKDFQAISNYKIGFLKNSKVGLSITLSPFTFDLLLPYKKTLLCTESILKKSFSKSNSKYINKEKEIVFSYLQCKYLLHTTGTKLWYLQKKETLTSFILKVSFYNLKTLRYSEQENKTKTQVNKKGLFLPFFKSSYLKSLVSNQFSKPFQKNKLSVPQTVFNNSNDFYKHHNFPIRPSYAQPEDYRRQFIKFLGNNSYIQNTDVPIFRYIQTSQLTNKRPIIENIVKQPVYQKSKTNFLSEKAIEVYFSEAKSVAKEQTIKKILSQTGGGGLQTYLKLMNLSELVLILQNDLSEIAPRLAKSQSTRRVLLSIINDASNNLTEAFFLLKNSTNKLQGQDKSVSVTSQKMFNKNDFKQTSSNTKQIDYTQLELSNRNAKETSYSNHLLLSDKIDILEKKTKDVKKEYKAVKRICSDFQNRKNAHKRRYKLAFQLLRTMSNPAGMTMSSVPVLPPGLRPIIDVPKIGPITADLNIRYRSLLFALRNLRELAYVDFRNAGAAQASVQEAVDDLLYTGGKTRREKPSSQNPNLYKSLAMRLKGKHGRFRGNLLGKRVDYSGRSVIVVGPTLQIHQCGLPFEIAIKLFNPFLIRSLIQRGFCKNVYKAKQILIRGKFKPLIWTLCQEVMSEHLVLLNRAPTLHRLGVQAFMPVLISGRAILLHPLVCTGFNADFDGDQMGVHVPLFPQARAEAWKMIWSRNNFLLPSSGEPVLLPSQDMVLGCYYLTCSTQKVLQTTFEIPKYNDNLSFPFTILNIKTALNSYTKGIHHIQSIVWINLNRTTFLKSGSSFQRYYKKQLFTKPWNLEIQKMENDGLLTPTLELRITPFGIMRLLSTGGIKSFSFQNSLLLPGRQAVKPPISALFVRTTIGRLIFNNLLEDLKPS